MAGSVRRTLALAFLVGLLAFGIGAFVAKATFPSSDELQRESLERLGLPDAVINSPIVKGLLDEFGGRVEDHVVDEARRSAFLGAGAGGLAVVAGFALVLADARRRQAAPPAEPAKASVAPAVAPAPVPRVTTAVEAPPAAPSIPPPPPGAPPLS